MVPSKPKLPLRCIVRAGVLTIEVDAATVKFATENHPGYWNEHTDARHGGKVKVTNQRTWLRSVRDAINRELGEDGSTLLTEMMDKAISEAVEQGEEGLLYDDCGADA